MLPGSGWTVMSSPPTPGQQNGAARESAPVPVRVILLGVVLVATGAVCLLAISRGWVQPHSVQQMVRGSGAAGMLVYVLAVVVLELLWMPRLWGLVAGGVLFGPVIGGALSVVADLSSAAVSYFFARSAAHDWVQSLLARRPKADRVVRLLTERRAGSLIALLRVCPVAHYTVVNYAAGVAGVRPWPFLLGTAVGLLPGAVLYPVLGDSLFRPGSAVFWASLALLAAALVATFLVGRRMLGRTGA